MTPSLGPIAKARLLRIVALGYSIWSAPKSRTTAALMERADGFLAYIRGQK